MNKLLISAAAIAILSAPVAFADDQDNNRQGQHEKAKHDDNTPDTSGDRKPDASGMRGPDAAGGHKPDTSGGGTMSPDTRNRPDRSSNDNDRMRDRSNDNDRDRGTNDNDRMRDRDNDRMRDRDHDNDRDRVINKTVVRKTVDRSVVLKFRANIRAPHRYHFARAYVRPAGWYPHRWVYGERLPRMFFAPEFFILDFAAYGLIEPWAGYEWVRYGDDALLIDVETGEIIRVEYDVFY